MPTNYQVPCQPKSTAQTRFPRLISDRAAEYAALRWQYEAEAHRLALCMWWHGFSEETAAHELSVGLARAAEKGKYRVRCGPLAAEMLSQALAELEATYENAADRIRNLVMECLAERMPRHCIEVSVRALVMLCEPQPTPNVVRCAVDEALHLKARRDLLWQEHEGRTAA